MSAESSRRAGRGYADVLIGLQFGDEGKAKVVDFLAPRYDIISRFNGGANAGHTIETNAGRLAFHQIPSGVMYPDKILTIGSGCVVNLQKISDEITKLESHGLVLRGRLHISDQCSVIQPQHMIIDALTGSHIGTTKNGIGPCYADKALRTDRARVVNIRLGDLLDEPELFFGEIRRNIDAAAHAYSFNQAEAHEQLDAMAKALHHVAPFVQRDTTFLLKHVQRGARVLFEGAQSYMLDVTKGMVPYVTSSSTVAAAAYVGGDLPPTFHRKTIGVAKAIMSRVGFGPFPSEFGGSRSEEYCMLNGGATHSRHYEEATYNPRELLRSSDPFERGIALRMLGNEYGSTTGRPRRTGALDLVQLASVVQANGVDELFLNKCDLLVDFADTPTGTIPLITGYSLRGSAIDYVPASNKHCREILTTTTELPVYSLPTRVGLRFEDLPSGLTTLLACVERVTKAKILGIGTGPKRDECVFTQEDMNQQECYGCGA